LATHTVSVWCGFGLVFATGVLIGSQTSQSQNNFNPNKTETSYGKTRFLLLFLLNFRKNPDFPVDNTSCERKKIVLWHQSADKKMSGFAKNFVIKNKLFLCVIYFYF
jgi:hypothetical protein